MSNEPQREPPDDVRAAIAQLVAAMPDEAALVLWRILDAWLAAGPPVAREE